MNLFLIFLDIFLTCIHDTTKKAAFENKISNKFIVIKFNEFLKFIEPMKGSFRRVPRRDTGERKE